MRLRTGLLTSCALAVLTVGSLQAQEAGTAPRQFPADAQFRPAAATATVSDTAQPAARPTNYYEELFGTPASEPAPAAIPTVEAQSLPTRPVSLATQLPAGGPVVPADYTSSFDGSSGIVQVDNTVPAAAPLTVSGSEVVPQGPLGEQAPSVTLTWKKQSAINVGQEAHVDLQVKNTAESVVANIVVQAYFPRSVRVTAAEPQPASATEFLSWTYESLKPGETQTIHISLIPSQRGELPTFASVRFTGASSEVFSVEEPLLKVDVAGPKEVRVGDPASQMITVTNPGTGVAENVRIEAVLPAGLEHPRGDRLSMEIGSLNPGESRKLRLALAAIDGGVQQLTVLATADGNLRQEAASNLMIIAPSLVAAIDGPGLRYMGRAAGYTVSVSNKGEATSNNVRVLHRLPDGFEFVSADRGGKFDPETGTVSWFVGKLDKDATADLRLILKATAMGDFTHSVAVVSEHGSQSTATMTTKVEGSASLVLEIVDLDDPVEVGIQTAYEVRVRNDGTANASNVGVSCELPGGVKLLTAKGPTDALSENGLLVFRSLPQLAPGKTAIYRVAVEGVIDGNHRFRARLASDSIQEPLIFEELTKFYRD